jgi:hypothetical protein
MIGAELIRIEPGFVRKPHLTVEVDGLTWTKRHYFKKAEAGIKRQVEFYREGLESTFARAALFTPQERFTATACKRRKMGLDIAVDRIHSFPIGEQTEEETSRASRWAHSSAAYFFTKEALAQKDPGVRKRLLEDADEQIKKAAFETGRDLPNSIVRTNGLLNQEHSTELDLARLREALTDFVSNPSFITVERAVDPVLS